MLIDLGISREFFFSDIYEKRLHAQRHAFEPGEITWRDLDSALFSWSAAEETLQLFHTGRVNQDAFVEHFWDVGRQRSRIVKQAFYGMLRDGATLVMNRLETKLEKIHELTMAVARFVGEKAVANGYVAFGGGGTFGRHWDTHDVFALQLIGRKHWRICAPTFEFPLQHQTSKHCKDDCPEQALFDDVVEAGDLLYIPRGFWHEAKPLENQETFHVAIGIHPAVLTDYFAWACRHALPEERMARASIRMGSIDDDVLVQKAPAAQRLLDPDLLAQFRRQLADADRSDAPFRLEQFARGGKPMNLVPNTPYASERGAPFTANGTRVDLDEASLHALADSSERSDSVAMQKIGSLRAQLQFSDAFREERVRIQATCGLPSSAESESTPAA